MIIHYRIGNRDFLTTWCGVQQAIPKNGITFIRIRYVQGW